MGRFDGKVALVTGAAGGIGRATAQAFGRDGARVVVNDVSEAGARETLQNIVDAGAEGALVVGDVSSANTVEAMVSAAEERFGGLDYACNNAAIDGERSLLHEVEESEFDRVLAVNLRGPYLCMKAEIPVMLRRGGGAIVNISSVAGLVALRGLGPYVASKHALLGLTRSAAIDLASRGIRVNAICPGTIVTPMALAALQQSPEVEAGALSMEPIGRLGRPEEIAAAVLYLCSEEASYVAGQAVAIDGGMSSQAGPFPPSPA